MFYLIWLIACIVLSIFGFPHLGIWGFILLCIVWGNTASESDGPPCEASASINSSAKTSNANCPKGINSTSTHSGTSYNTGSITHYSNGNSSVCYGDVTYYSNRIRSVTSGNVTYYFDDCNRQLGRSVDNGNGVHTYFDVKNREIGHSYTSGRITDFFDNCFQQF